jgi:GWxTD domain-containing protein
MARMTYVDLRFGLPEYGTRGWETDRGLVWLRYGEPLRQASYSPSTTDRGDFEANARAIFVSCDGRFLLAFWR